MTISTAQAQIVTAALAVDLAMVSDDRLIELCLMYRANPEQSSSFPADLETEIQRRFDAQALASEDVIFSTLVNLSNQFQSPIPLFYKKLQDMGASVNRDIWFQNNEQLFKDNIDDVQVMDWLLTQHDLLEKCLNNQFGLAWIAQNTNASTKVLTSSTAVDLWKQATNLWQIWPQHSVGMAVLAQSSTLLQYVIANSTALSSVVNSSVAMAEIAGSNVAMNEIITNSTALSTVVSSSVAMAEIAGSNVAMNEIITNSTALSTVVSSSVAMAKIAGSNVAMNEIITNSTALSAVINSNVALAEIAGSNVAMNEIITNSTALSTVVSSSVAMAAIIISQIARNAFFAHNQTFQDKKQALYDMATTHWVKKSEIFIDSGYSHPNPLGNVTALTSNQPCLVFTEAGTRTGYTGGRTCVRHSDGTVAIDTEGYVNNSFTVVTAVSFQGAIFNEPTKYGKYHIQIWAPQ